MEVDGLSGDELDRIDEMIEGNGRKNPHAKKREVRLGRREQQQHHLAELRQQVIAKAEREIEERQQQTAGKHQRMASQRQTSQDAEMLIDDGSYMTTERAHSRSLQLSLGSQTDQRSSSAPTTSSALTMDVDQLGSGQQRAPLGEQSDPHIKAGKAPNLGRKKVRNPDNVDGSECDQLYLQLKQASLHHQANLWQSMVPRDSGVARGKDAAHLFSGNCNSMRRYWQVNPPDCLPAQLAHSTPYSLALFARLAKFAKNIKDRQFAHDLLVETVYERRRLSGIQDELTGPPMECTTSTIYFPGHAKSAKAEETITENMLGLMLIDLNSAFQKILPARNNKESLDHASEKAKAVVESRRREKEGRQKSREETKRLRDQEQRPQEEGEVRESRKQRKLRKEQASTAVPGTRVEQQANLMDIVEANANCEPAELSGDKAERALLNTNNMLINSLTKAFESEKKPPNKGIQKRIAGRQALKQERRKKKQKQLPSEQMSFGSMPTLYSLKLDADQSKVLGDMEKLGLAAQQQLPELK